jgi:hypothetical protein
MDVCGNRFAITRSRPQAYYYALKKGERAGDREALLTTLLCKPCSRSIL